MKNIIIGLSLNFIFLSTYSYGQFIEKTYDAYNSITYIKQDRDNINLNIGVCDNDEKFNLRVDDKGNALNIVSTKPLQLTDVGCNNILNPNQISSLIGFKNVGGVLLNDSSYSISGQLKNYTTLLLKRYQTNGKLKDSITLNNPFPSATFNSITPYGKSNFILTINQGKPSNPLIGYIIYNKNFEEISRKAIKVDSKDPSPYCTVFVARNETDLYLYQASAANCSFKKIHKLVRDSVVWSQDISIPPAADCILTSLKENLRGDKLIASIILTRKEQKVVNFIIDANKAIPFLENNPGLIIFSSHKAAFGANNDVYMAQLVPIYAPTSRTPESVALEISRYNLDGRLLKSKRYFTTSYKDASSLPSITDILVSSNGALFLVGARNGKAWFFRDNSL
jgi:hypothetical protein